MLRFNNQKFNYYRYEVLLIALLLLLFDRIFFTNAQFYTSYVWPFNMIILGVASQLIFKERVSFFRWIKNVLFLLSVLIPLIFSFIVTNYLLVEFTFLVYVIYYTLIFTEVLRQIFQRSETNFSVIFGSVSGYLLLVVIAQFAFLAMEYNFPDSFKGISGESIPEMYDQLSYFSMVTLATVGYGDITPITIPSRLITMFFAISGQFYMIALVGIIISRFSIRLK